MSRQSKPSNWDPVYADQNGLQARIYSFIICGEHKACVGQVGHSCGRPQAETKPRTQEGAIMISEQHVTMVSGLYARISSVARIRQGKRAQKYSKRAYQSTQAISTLNERVAYYAILCMMCINFCGTQTWLNSHRASYSGSLSVDHSSSVSIALTSASYFRENMNISIFRRGVHFHVNVRPMLIASGRIVAHISCGFTSFSKERVHLCDTCLNK